MEVVLMPKVVKLYKQSKGGLKHNAGPYNPITRKEVKSAGSLREAYLNRGLPQDLESRQAKIYARLVEHPTPPVERIPKKKEEPFLTRVGKKYRLTTER